MRFGTWNVWSLCRSGSLKIVLVELAECKIDLVGVQEIRWDKGGTEPAADYTIFYGNGNVDHHLGTCFSVHKETIQVFNRARFS
jgi:exonuclease III